MGRNENLSAEDIRLDALVKSEYRKQAEAVMRHAQANVEDFPDDKEDEQRRFLEIMEEMRIQGRLTEEEEKLVFGFVAEKADNTSSHSPSGFSACTVEAAEEAADREDEKEKFMGTKKKKIFFRAAGRGRWKAFGRSFGKWAAIVAITCTGMFTLSMTSQANRQYVSDTVKLMFGKDTRVNINNDDGILHRDTSEAEARSDIADKLAVSVPVMSYKPKGLIYLGYEVYPESGCAIMHYELESNKLIIYISSNERKTSRSVLYDGKDMGNIDILKGEIEASLYESADKEDGEAYGAEWEYENTYYRLTGRLEWEDFEKIIKKIWY